MFSSVPALYPLDATSFPLSSTKNIPPDIAKGSLRGETALAENH